MRREQTGGVARGDFIGCWDLEAPELCDRLVEYFERHRDDQSPGFVGSGAVDTSIKKSRDIKISPDIIAETENDIFNEYLQHLNACFWDYLDQWDFLKSFLDKVHIGTFNLQKYDGGGHFHQLHSERTMLSIAHRVLVWMTYLNDVPAGGETEFPYFDLKVVPLKGKTLIWPAEWTHAHRGCVVERGPKYIITGWMHFAN